MEKMEKKADPLYLVKFHAEQEHVPTYSVFDKNGIKVIQFTARENILSILGELNIDASRIRVATRDILMKIEKLFLQKGFYRAKLEVLNKN